MNETMQEQLAGAVLDAFDTDAPLHTTLAGTDQAARRELRALEDAATIACVAFAGSEPMPARLANKLCAAGRGILAARAVARPRRRHPLLPFVLGAAAGIAAASMLWAPHREAPPTERRAALLQQSQSSRIDWQPGASRKHGTVHGDVVWSADRQEGYLRIDGLEPLPNDQQYQLWIVDADRTGAPVDGGLFDLHAVGENVVPITARLPVKTAKAFVVTVERRGGVVVSAQDDVVAIAAL